MKKVLSFIIIIISFFIIYILQSNFFSWFTIAGVAPNLLLIFILFLGLFIGKKVGFAFGILFGLYIDIVLGRIIGQTALMLGIIGWLGEYLDKNFSKESRMTLILMIVGSTIIYEIGVYIINIIKFGSNIEIISFMKILFIEIIYNIIIVIIIYPLMQKLGNILDNIFKSNKISTRYF